MRPTLILTAALLLLSACPRTDGQQQSADSKPMREVESLLPPDDGETAAVADPVEAAGEAANPAPTQAAAPEIYHTTDAAELVRDFGRFLNEQDLERYSACIHDQSPRRESLLWNYEDFQAGKRHVSIEEVRVAETEPGRALVSYSLTLSQPETGVTETEQGEFEVLQLADGNWVIWNIN